ncbi:DUF1801 domain-containing protein [Geodermatophilus sp. YIM 151500]|uniref:DUF1801 domain-containing protein n=1 Tax=Geodermatophilus sp. YIM 151500 TaxID=2984531 RepID=UPI0021E3B12F|nr:DUF1801 domain-containing protein [Geodermatophilus sp. YIM 151500]MCV2488377.1 DUF1801 domain-containing protein [Geodermatophilus sp. YIM 151500]
MGDAGDDIDDLDALVAALPAGAAELVRAADALIRTVDPQVVRVVWPHQRTVGYGVGRRKGSEHYCYLAVYGDKVNLGFNHGAVLPDEGRRLDGTGRSFRKLALRGPATFDDPGVAELLRAAREERLRSLGRT